MTWLNHYSALHADWEALRSLDFIGIDGTLLQIMLRFTGLKIVRSSADLVFPELLPLLSSRTDRRLVLVGGGKGVAKSVMELRDDVALALDGYGGLEALRAEPRKVLVGIANPVVILGLGAGLQDKVAVEIREKVPEATVLTAGGWLDQVASKGEAYFPTWAHVLRLGWFIRLVREPRRLYKRYTIDAARILWSISGISTHLNMLFEPSGRHVLRRRGGSQ